MSKERISASIDPDLAELLDQEHINKSGTVNKLLRKYFDGGADKEQILDFRIEQLSGEIEEMEQRLESKRQQLSRLQERRQGKRNEKEQTIQEAVEMLGPGDWTPDDRKIQYWANEAGVEETTLIDRLNNHHNSTSTSK